MTYYMNYINHKLLKKPMIFSDLSSFYVCVYFFD